MKRLLLNLLSILSLLLFLAAAALWVRSHFASDTLVWCPLSRSSDGFVSTEYLLDSRRGALHVGAIRHPYNKAEMPAVLYNVALAEHARQSFAAADRRWHSREPDDRLPTRSRRTVRPTPRRCPRAATRSRCRMRSCWLPRGSRRA